MRFDTDRNHHISMDIYSLLDILEKEKSFFFYDESTDK